MSKQAKHLYEFDGFSVDVTERLLLRDGETVPLTPKVFDILLALIENSGHIVDKDDLMEMVWPDTVVEEGNLNRNISTLRKALGESPGDNLYIETIPKRGYRFVAQVRESMDEGTDLIVTRYTRARIVAEEEEEAESRALLETGRVIEKTGSKKIAVAALLLAVLVASVSYYLIAGKSDPAGSGAALRSIAVLPFKPLVEGESDESLGLGMADALITRLSGIKEMTVRPTSAILKYNDSNHDAVEAGRELGVESLLDGRIQKSGGRIRVTVQLVSVRDGSTLWAQAVEENFTNIFAVQDSISEQVTEALALKLDQEEKKLLAKHYTENTEAYELYVKGRYFWNKRSSEGLKKGIEYFEQAIEKDPTYALAYAGLADSYVLGGGLRLPARIVMPRAREAATRALELDEQLAEAHASLALVKMAYDWDWPGAEREFKRAIELNRNYATARQWYSDYLAVRGRLDEALREAEQAQQLDPLSLIISRDVGRILYLSRQYDRSIEHLQKTLVFDPDFNAARFTLGFAYLQKGMYEEAVAEFQKASDTLGKSAPIAAPLSYAYAMSGKKGEARKILDELTKASGQRPVPGYEMAIMQMGLGRKDRAAESLERAFEERSYRLIYIGVDPMFDSLREDARFVDILKRMGLAA